jgi:hypothetical protein
VVFITQYGKPSSKKKTAQPLPEAKMPVWQSGDHFVEPISHRSVSAEMDNQGSVETGDAQLNDLLKHPASAYEGYDPLEKTDHSIHEMISYKHGTEKPDLEIGEDDPLRH